MSVLDSLFVLIGLFTVLGKDSPFHDKYLTSTMTWNFDVDLGLKATEKPRKCDKKTKLERSLVMSGRGAGNWFTNFHISVRGGPFLHTVFPICTMCWTTTHPSTCTVTKIQIIKTVLRFLYTHPLVLTLICTLCKLEKPYTKMDPLVILVSVILIAILLLKVHGKSWGCSSNCKNYKCCILPFIIIHQVRDTFWVTQKWFFCWYIQLGRWRSHGLIKFVLVVFLFLLFRLKGYMPLLRFWYQ